MAERGPATGAGQRVVVLGSANVDLVVRVERFPAPGETVLAPGYALHLGGKGANQAVAAARLGARVAFVGCVGADEHGTRLKAGLAAAGVDTGWLLVGEGPSGAAFIQVDAEGQNSIVVASGANAELSADRLPAEAFVGAGALLAQLELPLETVLAGAAAARACGAIVVLNLAPALALAAEQLANVDVLLLNEVEAALLAQADRDFVLAEPEAVAARLAEITPRVVITLGGRGVAWAERAPSGAPDAVATGSLPAHDVNVVDTTAAGDAFAGALTAQLVRLPAPSLAEAVRYANAAGALATTRAGAQPSLPTEVEVAALLSRAAV